MKTTFARQFALIAALLLLFILCTGVSFRLLMLNSMQSENEQTLRNEASAVADLARAYDTVGEPAENWDFRMSLSLITQVSRAEALICDADGTVQLCSCGEFACRHLGTALPQAVMDTARQDGAVSGFDAVSGIYEERRFYSAVPILAEGSGEIAGFVLVTMPATQFESVVSRSTMLLFLTSAGVAVAALLAAVFFSRTQVRPLAQVAEAARKFGHGDLSARVSVPKSSTLEVTELAQSFNTMAESLQQSERRRQEFVANVSHELKTPMTTIGGFIDGMLDGTIPPEKHTYYMQTVSAEVRRLSRLVRNMLDISRLQAQGVEESRKTRFDVSEVIGDVLISFEQKINAKKLQVTASLPERAVYTRADRDGITQVLYNLTDNAVKFCPENGRLGLRLDVENAKAVVTVRNTGPTIAPEELPLLFDRFHKTDKSRSADRDGWGLGLYIAKTILDAHGEDIFAESADGVTTMRFTLPIVR